MSDDKPKKTLVLHITVPGFYADDLDDCAREFAEGEDPTPEDRLEVVLEEWMRRDVVTTVIELPGEKSGSNGYEMHAYKGRIVGAELIEGNQS